MPEFDLLAESDSPAMLAATATTTPTVSIPSTAAPYMVWGWKPSKAAEYENSTGGDIKSKVVAIVHAFQAVKKDNKEQMANAFMKMGIWGVGLVGLRAAWGALRAAAAISEAVEVAAIAEGIFNNPYLLLVFQYIIISHYILANTDKWQYFYGTVIF